MRYGLIAVSLLASIICVFPVYSAENLCSYCGVWIPFSEKYDSPYSASDRLTITEQTVALPGCSPIKATQVFLTDKTKYSVPETMRPKFLTTILQIEGPMNCAKPFPGLSKGALVQIELSWHGFEGSEEIDLTLFAPNNLKELKASFTDYYYHPPQLGGWWFIREKFDPCGTGEGRGAWICSSIQHKKADDALNAEWKRLINVISPDKKRALITTQKKWLKACESKCAREGGAHGGYHPWPLAIETSCLASEKRERSVEFRELSECIRSGRLDCPQLKDKP